MGAITAAVAILTALAWSLTLCWQNVMVHLDPEGVLLARPCLVRDQALRSIGKLRLAEAESAARRGDFRRAAGGAIAVLKRGDTGCEEDALVLYRTLPGRHLRAGERLLEAGDYAASVAMLDSLVHGLYNDVQPPPGELPDVVARAKRVRAEGRLTALMTRVNRLISGGSTEEGLAELVLGLQESEIRPLALKANRLLGEAVKRAAAARLDQPDNGIREALRLLQEVRAVARQLLREDQGLAPVVSRMDAIADDMYSQLTGLSRTEQRRLALKEPEIREGTPSWISAADLGAAESTIAFSNPSEASVQVGVGNRHDRKLFILVPAGSIGLLPPIPAGQYAVVAKSIAGWSAAGVLDFSPGASYEIPLAEGARPTKLVRHRDLPPPPPPAKEPSPVGAPGDSAGVVQSPMVHSERRHASTAR